MCQKKIMRKRSSEKISEEPPKKRISPGGNLLPPQIVPGEILTDLTGKQWRLGKTIGCGGFGEIYLASDNIKEPVKNDAQYVVKVENHSNGPLFVEINCLLRIARLEMINDWKKQNSLSTLGMPHYVASGSHSIQNEKIRFLIIPRFDQDLEKIYLSKQKKINLKTVVLICSQILDALEYIHSKGYVHCDVKASNIMNSSTVNQPVKSPRDCKPIRNCRMKIKPPRKNLRQQQRINYDENVTLERVNKLYSTEIIDLTDDTLILSENQVVLIDYGLATKYLHSNGNHKQFCNDERKAHAGTILFCSIDSHLGANSRRSDLESLGYNLVYWLTSNLPWSNDVNNPEIVQSKKETCLNNLDAFLKSCFQEQDCPNFIYEYFRYVKSLTFESKPDYNFCRKLLLTSLLEYSYKNDGKFDFDNLEGWGQKPKKSFENHRKKPTKTIRMPLTSNILVEKPILRKKSNKKLRKKKLIWSKILSDPEEILRQNNKQISIKTRERKLTESSDSSCNGNSLQNLDIFSLNPTYAMLEVYNKSRDKNSNYHKNGKGDSCETLEQREGFTPIMNTILTKMHQRRIEELAQQETEIINVSNSGRRTRNVKSSDKKRVKTMPSITKEMLKRKTRSARILRGYGLRG